MALVLAMTFPHADCQRHPESQLGNVAIGYRLAWAARWMKIEWVRNFMLQRDCDASDLALLTCPRTQAASYGCSGAVRSVGGSAMASEFASDLVFYPTLSVGDITVGLALERMVDNSPLSSRAESLALGKFCMVNSTFDFRHPPV